MTSNTKLARVAGLLYLFVAVFSGFGFFYRVSLIVPGDAATTVSNILASEWLFRVSFVSDLCGQVCFIFLGLALYKLLCPVNKTHALVMVVLVLVSVPMTMINLLNQFAVVLLLSGADYLTVFPVAQLHALVLLFLDLLEHGVLIVQIFWGLWLLPLGLLVFKSGFLPRLIGILLMVGCFIYVLGSFTSFLFPTYAAMIESLALVAGLGEFSFILWLLIRGVDAEKMKGVAALESSA